ncbi:PREDICTED: cytochrome P450 87A3-like [Fragaria vesca subsp. vesca]|uniref:cytochrome P450 87A3-like n=1 Tax=Fragaria vesca subsp. vesca TaxID=101020 RepID=UPI0002C2E4AD|nr:PREDICTED: cytochrome P450 87A3-like [Fragaria vesca subsp. vesca]
MLGVCIVALVAIGITHWVYRWRNPRCNGKLPPGSMGWPLIGETLQYLAPNSSFDVPPFIKTRRERYGPIFKSQLMGAPFIVSTDPELNMYVFQQDDKLFQSGYPDSVQKIFGKQQMGNVHVLVYKYLKRMTLNLIGPESLKKALPEIEQAIHTSMQQWSFQDTTDVKEAAADMIFSLSAKRLMSYDSSNSSDNLRANFSAFADGLIAIPLNIPGTAFHKCLQGRDRVLSRLKDMLQERRATSRKQPIDFFDYVLQELDKEGTVLTEEICFDLMFLLLYTSFETTSTAMTLLLKFVSEHPPVLKQLTEEHEKIIKRRENANSGLTWEEYKSMKFTLQVINETVRLASQVPGIFRKAIKEVQFKGYTIPEGWSVLVCFQPQHLNPEKYEDPLAFNPWRWEGKESGASKDFMAFGGGLRSCVGAEFGKVKMAVFVHFLVTKYRWEVIGGKTVRNYTIQFPGGFHIRMQQKDTRNGEQPITPDT